MKKAILRTLCAFLAALVLLGCVSFPTFAEQKTEIGAVAATSDLDEVAVLYGRTKKLVFTLTEGEPVYFGQNWVTCWETYNEESGKWENYSGRFYPGRYRVFAQIRIDGEASYSYALSENVTCTVDGKAWTVDSVSVHYNYSCAFVTSPEIVIEDDPALTPPIDLYDVYLDLNGYVADKKFSETSLYPHLGSEEKIEIVDAPVFFDLTDANYDGVPDSWNPETEEFVPADDTIKASTSYMIAFSIKGKAGYDLYPLEISGIHLSERETGMLSCFLSYNDLKDCYQIMLTLRPCVTELFFSINPADAVGYYRNELGSVEISWETNGAVDKYQIYRWDAEDEWDVLPYTDVFGSSFDFEYLGDDTAYRYRIEAIKGGESVAVSDEFTVSWQRKQPIRLPVRIDARAAVGSKTPVDLCAYYPASVEYDLKSETLVLTNQWIDAETGLPVDSFEHGRQYAYAVCVKAKEGYYLDIQCPPTMPGEDPIVPDAVRIYGIGWDRVINEYDAEGEEYIASFVFTYDETVGIPAEQDNLLYELVFDGSSLVGMNHPTRIPNEILAHDGLTICDENCDCETVPDFVKSLTNKWLTNGMQPAEAFEEGIYRYVIYFHIEEGWEISSVLNHFDFVISGTSLETVEVMYSPELRILGVDIGFPCGESKQIEAGDHTCSKRLVEAVSPTCTENGTVAHYACGCGKTYLDKWGFEEIVDVTTYGSVLATGHSHGTEWRSDADKHWNECACGDRLNQAAHADGDGDGKCDACLTQLPDEENSGLGTGAIVGIVIGAVAVVGVGAGVLAWYLRKKKRTQAPDITTEEE